ncbi:MAG: HAD hydrolase-like protein [Methylococcales bacterium]|nr:HAD hydrolase-like protein [Methylococcales bacterium]
MKHQPLKTNIAIKAIIFDRYGTLVDFSDMFLCFIHDIYSQQNILPDTDAVILSYEFWHQIISEDLHIGEIRVCDHLNEIPLKYIPEHGKFYQGIEQTIHNFHNKGLKMTIVSGRVGTEATEILLKRLGVFECFECVLTQDDLEESHFAHQKPGSATIKTQLQKQAINHLNLPLESILVVGDAPDDIESGQALKLKTIAVMTGNGQKLHKKIRALNPNWIVDSVAELKNRL